MPETSSDAVQTRQAHVHAECTKKSSDVEASLGVGAFRLRRPPWPFPVPASENGDALSEFTAALADSWSIRHTPSGLSSPLLTMPR